MPGEPGKKGGVLRRADVYLEKLREYAALLKAQGEALRRGQLEAARQKQELAEGLRSEIGPLLAFPIPDEGVRAEVEKALRGLLAEAEAQLSTLALLKEEVAEELGEICRWRQRLQAFRLAYPPTAGQNVDLRG